MNDLMTKSFLSYVELKKQAQKDLESDEHDIEKGNFKFNPEDEQNLSGFFQEVESIKTLIEEIAHLSFDHQSLKEETQSTHSTKILRGLRDRMESNIVSILRKAKTGKSKLDSLEKSNVANLKISESFREGSCIDRTRISITNGLRSKFREMMNDFQLLREKILKDYREDLKRKNFLATSDEPTDEAIDKMISGSGAVQLFESRPEMDSKIQERHEAVNDIKRSLTRLHHVFLDMAVLLETQGECIDDIEANMANARRFVNGGTNNLYFANQMKKKRTWVFWVWIVGMIVLLVCIISMLASR